MIVTVIDKEGIQSTILPVKVKGQFWLNHAKQTTHRLVSVEAVNHDWVMKSTKSVKITDSSKQIVKQIKLESMHIYILKELTTGENIVVFTEPETDNRQLFSKYRTPDNLSLSIGRSQQNEIIYANKFASSKHAVLTCSNRVWSVADPGSTNGLFVNQKRVQRATLAAGDLVYVMGLKIVIGNGFIAMNNPDQQLKFTTNLLMDWKYDRVIVTEEDDEYELPETESFYPSPRFKRDIETATFKIDSPPQSPIKEELPWILVMGSSLAMGMMSCVTLVSALSSGNVTSMAMGASMLLGSVLLPNISKKYQKKRALEKEALRQEKYKAYIDTVYKQIQEACKLQTDILCENFITAQECEGRIVSAKRNLWERTLSQNDFLRLRLGTGEGLLDANFSYSERHFSLEEDNLQGILYHLCETPQVLKNIPITYSLVEDYISGILGDRARVCTLAKALIFQLAAFYSSEEVKMIFLYDQADQAEFEFVKWLPHVWNDAQSIRFIATDASEEKELSSYFEPIIEYRSGINQNDLQELEPYYIVFSMSKTLANRSEMIKQLLAKKKHVQMSVVCCYDELRDLPKECSKVVELNQNYAKLYDKNDTTGKAVLFTADLTLHTDARALSVALANVPLSTQNEKFKLPNMINFLQMFEVGKVEHLNALTRWAENDPTKSLEAMVGVDSFGQSFKLDLHEKFHGPHGLVAGMTGSGKSEFIITYILSLAVNYHPHEVAFILIDYKGGGMAKSFEHLPHTAGIITNLDGAAIKRSLVSIESELKRRQAIFAQASAVVGESNIDIYKYQKLYREGRVVEPLQHLFIISDEFAELKTQQPEFMTQLVSAARIGRSLGVHLVLATQKPSGVVDDQIWSNSKFRVCLKVQDRNDSMDMLKRPDAAELTQTGRFYLQVGYNELFEIGQSAWSGATYQPTDRVVVDKDTTVSVVDRTGHVIKQAKLQDKKSSIFAKRKQMDVITEYLSGIAKEEQITVRKLWLDPIPAVVLWDDLHQKYRHQSTPFALNPLIGEYDDPARQRQCALTLSLSKEGNVIVYGAAGSGKTSFLNTLVYALLSEHTPEEVNLYLLDFGSQTLGCFGAAPHVGDVVLPHEEEKVQNLFKMIRAEVERRKRLFAAFGGDYANYIQYSGQKLPSILLAIHNFAAFTELYPEKEEAVSLLSREGSKYGIYFVLTSLGTSGVRFRLQQNFKQQFALQLNDESDYSLVVGKTDGLIPTNHKGRGLCKLDGLYEFQIASLTTQSNSFVALQSKVQTMVAEYQGTTANKIPILPDRVDSFFLQGYLNQRRGVQWPIGVDQSSLQVCHYPFDQQYITPVLSDQLVYRGFLSSLTTLIKGHFDGKQLLVFDLPKTWESSQTSGALIQSTEQAKQEVANLFDLVLDRNNRFKEADDGKTALQQDSTVVVVVNSLLALKQVLDDQENQKLSLVLEKGSADYHIHFILGEDIKSLPNYSFEPWYKAQITQHDGIWIGDGFQKQYQLKVNKQSKAMQEEIGDGFGYLISQGKSRKIKRLNDQEEETQDDE